jgi:TonB family protein
MRAQRWVFYALLAALMVSCDRVVVVQPTIEISPSIVTLAPGATQRFVASVDGLTGYEVGWGVFGGGVVSPQGLYKAPYYVGPGASAVVRASIRLRSSRHRVYDEAHVALREGVFPNADSCRGVHQNRIPELGEYVYVEVLPEAIVKVVPQYPDSARANGIQGTVIVNALVCRSGNVLDTWIAHSIPALDDATAEAVRQWIFKPAEVAGEPIAVWVTIPIRFTLH